MFGLDWKTIMPRSLPRSTGIIIITLVYTSIKGKKVQFPRIYRKIWTVAYMRFEINPHMWIKSVAYATKIRPDMRLKAFAYTTAANAVRKQSYMHKLSANFRICFHFIVANKDISFSNMRIFFTFADFFAYGTETVYADYMQKLHMWRIFANFLSFTFVII